MDLSNLVGETDLHRPHQKKKKKKCQQINHLELKVLSRERTGMQLENGLEKVLILGGGLRGANLCAPKRRPRNWQEEGRGGAGGESRRHE